MQNIVSNALNYFWSLLFLSTWQAENQNISKCIISCLRVLQGFSEKCVSKYRYYLLATSQWCISEKNILKHEPISTKILWRITLRKINIPHSVNEDEEVYVVILDISTVKTRQLNQIFILFKKENSAKTVLVSKHYYTCHTKNLFCTLNEKQLYSSKLFY